MIEHNITSVPQSGQNGQQRVVGHRRQSTEFVGKDVRLAKRVTPLISKNLLSKSLSFKVRGGIRNGIQNQGNGKTNKSSGSGLNGKRDKDHKVGLHREYTSDLTSHMDRKIKRENSQKIRQEQMARKNDENKRKQAFNSTKKQSFGQFPPIKSTEKSSLDEVRSNQESSLRDHSSVTPSASSSDVMSVRKNTFITDDDACVKAAMDAVRFTNNNGIFLPNDRYAASRYAYRHAPSPSPSGETILLGTGEASTKISRRSHKRVTWSSVSDSAVRREPDSIHCNKAWKPKSSDTRCNPAMWQRVPIKSNRSRIEFIGVQWSTSQHIKKSSTQPEMRRSHSSISGCVSKNVLPMTIGMDHRGTSVSKTKWAVPSSSKQDATEQWLNGLNFVKQPTAKERQLESKMFRPQTEISSQIIFERTQSEVRE